MLQKFRQIKLVKEAKRQRRKERRVIQSKEMRYECEVCGKIVKSSGGLLRHKKIHRK